MPNETEFLKINDLVKILQQVTFMGLTTCADSKPWCSPVFYAFDSNFNFYWKSSPLARHSKNIESNPNTSITIFNSIAPDGEGWGIYLEGKSEVVTDHDEITRANKISYQRTGHPEKNVAWLLDESCPRKFYRFIPGKAWTNGVENINGVWVDIRQEINLSELKKSYFNE